MDLEAPRYREEYPALDMNALVRAGLFAQGDAVLELLPGVGLDVRLDATSVGDETWVVVSGPGASRRYEWSLPLWDAGQGAGRKFFFCPDADRRCTKLFFRHGEWASAEHHGLINASRNLTSLSLERLTGSPGKAVLRRRAGGRGETTDETAGGGASAGETTGWRLADEWPLGTWAAMERARSRGMEAYSSYGLRLARDVLLERAASQAPQPCRGAKALTLSVACLDSRTLANSGALLDGMIHPLLWEVPDEAPLLLQLYSNAWAEAPYVALIGKGEGMPAVTVIDLFGTPEEAPTRWRFVCPITGDLCDLLYLRDGVFGSREAQRLIHPSQHPAVRRLNAARDKAEPAPEPPVTPRQKIKLDRMAAALGEGRVLVTLAARMLNVAEAELLTILASHPELLTYVETLKAGPMPWETYQAALEAPAAEPVASGPSMTPGRGGREVRVAQSRTYATKEWRRPGRLVLPDDEACAAIARFISTDAGALAEA